MGPETFQKCHSQSMKPSACSLAESKSRAKDLTPHQPRGREPSCLSGQWLYLKVGQKVLIHLLRPLDYYREAQKIFGDPSAVKCQTVGR